MPRDRTKDPETIKALAGNGVDREVAPIRKWLTEHEPKPQSQDTFAALVARQKQRNALPAKHAVYGAATERPAPGVIPASFFKLDPNEKGQAAIGVSTQNMTGEEIQDIMSRIPPDARERLLWQWGVGDMHGEFE